MKVVISRRYSNTETTGRLVAFDGDRIAFQVVTIEPPNNGNQHNTSCIPEGTYTVTKIYSIKHGNCFSINDVPNRDHVEMHIGNYAAGKKVDTEGCILPGIYFADINEDGNIDVAESTQAMSKLLNFLPDKFELYVI